MKKVELLAPAGNFEKLELAIHYGADAVYLAGKDFSLRNFSENFSIEEIDAAVRYANRKGVKVYVAVNIFARNDHLTRIQSFLESLKRIKPHGIIIADMGLLAMTRRILPEIPLHISTQANTTNYETVQFLKSLGAARVNMARELSLDEIKTISENTDLEIEAFIHGAMCISYSGRCLLSNFMANRPSNQGMCCHPCRFQYALVEELRKDETYPVREDEYGTYFFNSKDLCMIDYLPGIIQSGITSLKIEGRMKGIHYVATVVNAYRKAIDAYYLNPEGFKVPSFLREELWKVDTRGYCTGFYTSPPLMDISCYESPDLLPVRIAGKVIGEGRHHRTTILVKNRIRKGDCIDILSPLKEGPVKDVISLITDRSGREVEVAQSGSEVDILVSTELRINDIIRTIEMPSAQQDETGKSIKPSMGLKDGP